MRSLALTFLVVSCLLLTHPVSAQTLAADYQLQNIYTSSAGVIGPLTVTGDSTQVAFVPGTVDGQPQQVLQIGVNSAGNEAGVQTQTNPFVDSSDYSAVLLASFQISPSDTGITKVFDFQNLSSDAGLYVNDATGLLGFYDGGGMLLGLSATPILSGDYVQIALTRDVSNGVVTVYANGTLQFSFADPTGLAILGDASNTGNSYLTLFQDDGMGTGGSLVDEGTRGDIARLRLYDGVLSAAQVAALDRTVAVPEPAAAWFLALGAISLVAAKRHRRHCDRDTAAN